MFKLVCVELPTVRVPIMLTDQLAVSQDYLEDYAPSVSECLTAHTTHKRHLEAPIAPAHVDNSKKRAASFPTQVCLVVGMCVFTLF